MNPENYYQSLSRHGAAACCEEELLLRYAHYLLKGVSLLTKAKSSFNTIWAGGLESSEGSRGEKEQREEPNQAEEDTLKPGTFLI